MIPKVAGLCLLVLLAQARGEDFMGGFGDNFPSNLFSNIKIGFSNPIWEMSYPSSSMPIWKIRTRAPTKNREEVTEKNDYPDLETMDVEDDKTALETNPTSNTEININSDVHTWSPFSSNGFADLFQVFGGISKWKPWWQKENVCIETEEEDNMDETIMSDENDKKPSFFSTSTINLQTCYQTNTKYECVQKIKTPKESRTVTVRYQCCYGHQRKNDGDCEKIDLIPMIEKIKELNGSEFLTLAKNMKEMLTEQNVTVFLPTNEAFRDFAEKMLETNQLDLVVDSVRRRRSASSVSTEDLINVHMAKGFNEVTPDEVYSSLYENSSLTIKHVISSNDESQFLVNCARVLSSNNYAINGIVHTIDRVLMPATKSILEIVKTRKNFSTLRLLLEKTGLAESLDSNTIWTLIAPTNKAFEKLQWKHPHLMQKLLRGDACTTNILKHHMLSYTFCSAAVQMGATGVRNSMGNLLRISENMNKTEDNTLDFIENDNAAFYLDKVGISEADIVASNGVIHAIDELLIPDAALPITSLLKKKKLSLVYELIEKADMVDEINSLSNVTFIFPTDKAIKNFLKNDEQGKFLENIFNQKQVKDKTDLRSFIYHHVISGALQSCDLDNNMMKEPLDLQSPLRINLYSTIPMSLSYNRASVDCARLQHFDLQQCDNTLHQIDRPLLNNNESIMERIKNNPKLSMLYKILVDSEIESILDTRDNITFIAPTNEAFEKMPASAYNLLLKDKKMVNMLMKQHIFDDVMCCSGLYDAPWPFTKSLQSINGDMSRIGKNKIGGSTISSCDHMGTNGVVHLTDKFTTPNFMNVSPGKSNVDILLYGVDI